MTQSFIAAIPIVAMGLAFCACGEDSHGDEHENEVITTITLSFTPTGGGTALAFEFNDEDGDGGAAPIIDPISLPAGDYDLAVSFENRLEDPAEDITEEISDEATEHQIFFTGNAVEGPATNNTAVALVHAYDDQDSAGNPVGLANTITAATGTGTLTVTLLHLPDAKIADLTSTIRDNGFGGVGNTDATADFSVTVP